MMGMLKPKQGHCCSHTLEKGNAIMCAFLLSMVIVLAVALGNHREQIDGLTRRIEALEKGNK